MISRARSTRTFRLTFGLASILAASMFSCGSTGVANGQIPARDAFAGEAKTPAEIWERVDYLIKIGQPELAAPFVKKFLDGKPDDEALLDVRDTYGAGSVLKLSEYPETRPTPGPWLA